MTVSLRPLHVSVRENVYWCHCVFFLLSLRTSSPIRLLCSVMGAQGGLRLAPWSVLIWLAFRYGSDTLPPTRRETRTAPPHTCHLLHWFSFPFLSLQSFLSLSSSLSDTHIFFPCLHLSFHTTTPGWGKMRTNWYESQGKKPGGKKERKEK